jgi:mitochondrial pyruvate carrier 2
MSKYLISGASFFEYNRPTDKVSLPQYTALTLTGFFFSRYALLVTPINYVLCSVNILLFVSSAWHLGRKINADYINVKPPPVLPAATFK